LSNELNDTSPAWTDLVAAPGAHDHIVQLYSESDPAFLVDAVARFVGTGLRQGEAALVIARKESRATFEHALSRDGLHPHPGLNFLDADETLARFMVDGMPQWTAFHEVCGGIIAELRLQYPKVRAYGEMVDILWQRGEQKAAIQLEEFWNDLSGLQTFSLLCAYAIDPLDGASYAAGLASVCRTHTHVIPARSYERFNRAVSEAIAGTLDDSLVRMLFRMVRAHRTGTEMPLGQAALLWLRQNMPRTADRVLEQVRGRLA
jgi:hypothetical protein